ncbi:MAG TPA: hypothetical protein VJ954_06225 [Ignavibacteriaceae bacterium]|nr:hypothetical protein [Ignavibacteriaceae bacterium]
MEFLEIRGEIGKGITEPVSQWCGVVVGIWWVTGELLPAAAIPRGRA